MAIRAAAYARFSSDNQRDESIDAQLRAIRQEAAQKGYVVVKEYIDRAKSATSDKRPEFQQMIRDSELGLWDVVMVHKLDRFSRDKYDSAKYKHKLKVNGVKLISVTERLDGSPESVILESLLEGMAEYYSKNLARETMKGMKENAYKCKHTGGIPPLGYNVDPETKRLVLNEYEADTIRLIFQMYLNDYGYDRIITELNSLGRKTKLDRTFGKNSLHDILLNEKYAGVFVFNCSASKDARGKRNNHARKDNEDIIRIEGGVPAIVDRATFDQVQAKMERNKRSPGAYKSKELYLLSGLIFCGECSKPDGTQYAMAGNRHKCGRSQSMYVPYRCSNRDRTKLDCINTELRREYVEGYVLHELQRRIFNRKNIPVLTRKLNEHLKKSTKSGQEELKKVKAELVKVSNQINNIVSAVVNGTGFQSLLDKMGELEDRQAQLQMRLDELQSAKQDMVVTEDDVGRLFTKFDQAVKDRNVPKIKKFVDNYVERVIVFRDHVEVTFRVAIPDSGSAHLPYEIQTSSTRNKLNGSGTVA